MKIYYDMHIHSCLSPCADNDMLPCDIAGMGALNGLSLMALTDHNSCKNCPAFFEACKAYNIIAVAGMELTTAEDIHVICLFRQLYDAMRFSDFIFDKILNIQNKPEIFGDQIVTDRDGNETDRVMKLLISATDISIDEVPEIVKEYGGICYPAHVDRESNGVIAVLGDVPKEADFTCFELNDSDNLTQYLNDYPSLRKMSCISSSDAHSLIKINTALNFIEIDDLNDDLVLDKLFEYLERKN